MQNHTCTAGAGVLLLCLAAPAFATGFESHRIVAREAADCLPDPIAPLFMRERLAFLERSLEPATVWPRDSELRRRECWHHVPLDLAASAQTRAARLEAAARFPRTPAGARALYNEHHVRQGGTLPWAIEDLYRELVDAFRKGSEEDVVRAAGHLAHFAGECASPFSATINASGQLAGNLQFGSRQLGEELYPHQSVQYRFDLELVNRNGSRYRERIHLSSSDYESIGAPVDRSFSVLLDSLGCLDELLAADREILAQLAVTDAAGFLRRANEYYVLLDERCGDIYVDRLQAAARLAGGLIGGAWEAAGRPDAETIRSRTQRGASAAPTEEPAADDPTRAPSEPTPEVTFVGSKGSKVFHRSDCSHAARIRDGNRVVFQTAEEAKRQGRRPCRTCMPEG